MNRITASSVRVGDRIRSKYTTLTVREIDRFDAQGFTPAVILFRSENDSISVYPTDKLELVKRAEV